jgi:large subunit ribosomal protein L1
VDRAKVYEPAEALRLLKGLPAAKFDETVEVAVDARHRSEEVRSARARRRVAAQGLGKSVQVIVFAEGDKAEAARAGGPTRWARPDLCRQDHRRLDSTSTS